MTIPKNLLWKVRVSRFEVIRPSVEGRGTSCATRPTFHGRSRGSRSTSTHLMRGVRSFTREVRRPSVEGPRLHARDRSTFHGRSSDDLVVPATFHGRSACTRADRCTAGGTPAIQPAGRRRSVGERRRPGGCCAGVPPALFRHERFDRLAEPARNAPRRCRKVSRRYVKCSAVLLEASVVLSQMLPGAISNAPRCFAKHPGCYLKCSRELSQMLRAASRSIPGAISNASGAFTTVTTALFETPSVLCKGHPALCETPE